jgi:hypothetical protein
VTATFVGLVLSLGVAQVPQPPPLTAEQREKIAKLANDTQREAVRLKAQLEKRQRDLNRLYAEYELDEKEAKAIEADIVDLQRQMLANYRTMQTELRTLVGKERFLILKKRLDLMLQSADKPKDKKDDPVKR